MIIIFCPGCFTSGDDTHARARRTTPCTCATSLSTNLSALNPNRKPRSGGELSIRVESEPGLLLSMYSAHPSVTQIVDHDIMEALVKLDDTTGDPVPELAEYWESNIDHTVFTFFLVQNAEWHDGKPFSAEDVEYTFTQLFDPAGGAVVRSQFEDIANVTADERYKVVFELDNPRPDFVTDISRIMILPEHIFKNTTVVSNETARAPIGTGPFVFGSWKKGQFIEIKRNMQWRKGVVPLEKVTYKFVPERRVAVELFNGRSLDILTDAYEATAKDAQRLDFPLQKIDAWVFQTRGPYFSDARTRQAVSKLIDRDAIACSIMSCLAKPIHSPWSDITVPNHHSRFSPKEARALLKAAGWKDRDGDGILERNGVPFSFTLLLPDTDVSQTRAVTVIAHDLRKAGIEMNLTVVSWAVYTDRLRKHRFDASVLSISTAPPFNAAELFHTDGIQTGRNFGQFSDVKIDALFDSLLREQDPDKRAALHRRIAKRLDWLQPMSFTFHPYQRYLVRNGIFGVTIGADGIEERRLWLANPGGTR
ncbi:MAG: hypothetical protein JXX29_01030 [Deltaproteobacteria bacterium]|nr:hypothetical protein [Deltaproteobacteria bacterium]MBN2670221.1 hypothetical protein [Deltaproteobacteria bacterium]